MQKLIMVRHGKYERETGLTNEGKQDMEKLARMIGSLTNGSSKLIITSPVERAVQSAKILGKWLYPDQTEVNDLLQTSVDIPPNLPALDELVTEASKRADVLILVSHYEFLRDFPPHFYKAMFNHSLPAFSQTLLPGQAWVIDTSNGNATCIRTP